MELRGDAAQVYIEAARLLNDGASRINRAGDRAGDRADECEGAR